MDTRTLGGFGAVAACLVGIVWLTAAMGLLPPGLEAVWPDALGGGSQLTEAPDKVQHPSRNEAQQPAGGGAPAVSASQAENAVKQSRQGAGSKPKSKPTPSPEPEPHYTTSSTVNVRAGQGTNYRVTGQVEPGEAVTLVEDPGGKWIRIQGSHAKGWVYRPLFHKTD